MTTPSTYHSQCMLLSMEAYTQVERTVAEEEEAWDTLYSLFCTLGKDIRRRLATGLLEEEETSERFLLMTEEKCATTKLEMKIQFLRHGVKEETADIVRLAKKEDVLSEVVFYLPTILETQESELETTRTVSELIQDLRSEADDVDCHRYLEDREWLLFAQAEWKTREAIQEIEQSDRSQMKNTFDRWLKAYINMELELEVENPLIVMAQLAEIDRIKYFTRPAIAKESLLRVNDMIDEEQTFDMMMLQCEEGANFMDLLERFLAGRQEIIDNHNNRIVQHLLTRSGDKLLQRYFWPWTEWANEKARTYRAVVAIDYLQRRCMERLLKRGCEAMNSRPQHRRFVRQQKEFCQEQIEDYVRIVVSEEEERGRMAIGMDWLWTTEETAELFFAGRDSLRMAMLARQIAVLGMSSEEWLLRMRLERWYKFARRKGLNRRRTWIYNRTRCALLQRYLAKWARYPAVCADNQEECEQLEAIEDEERRFWVLEEEESYKRLFIARHWERVCRHRLEFFGRLPLSWQQQEENVMVLLTSVNQRIRGLYLSRWKRFARYKELSEKVHTLERKNGDIHRMAYFGLWMYATTTHSLALQEDTTRRAIVVDQRRTFRQLLRPHALRMLDEIRCVVFNRYRDDVCFRWLICHYRKRNRREVSKTIDERGDTALLSVLRRKFVQWKLFRWHRVKERIAEELERSANKELLARFFARLDPLQQQMTVVSRLRKQLQAVRVASVTLGTPEAENEGKEKERERGDEKEETSTHPRPASEAPNDEPQEDTSQQGQQGQARKARSRHTLFLERPQRSQKKNHSNA